MERLEKTNEMIVLRTDDLDMATRMRASSKIVIETHGTPSATRWLEVVRGYSKRIPDNMTPSAHMASSILAADMLINAIEDRGIKLE